MASHILPGGSAVRHRVAVVDDRFDVRELVTIRLAMVQGLEVVGQAANGAEAIRLAQRLRPDLMTLDLEMPVMGGADAIPLLRAAAPNMRIVVFSADPARADLSNGNQPDAIVAKGSHLANLVAIILGLLSEGKVGAPHVDSPAFAQQAAR
jgi:two-component system, chemotaxis family, chemotaxis protein CheY